MVTTLGPVAGVSDAVCIDTGNPGPAAVIFCGVHGNEESGVKAVAMLRRALLGQHLRLRCGSVVLATGNPEAVRRNARFLRYDMNRLCIDRPRRAPAEDDAEFRRSRQLMRLLKNATHFLDLHSTSAPSRPYFLTEDNDVPFFAQVADCAIVTGWDALGEPSIAGTAMAYARSCGAISATLEAGQHHDASAVEVAFEAASRFLEAAGLVDAVLHTNAPYAHDRIYRLAHAMVKRGPQFRFLVKDAVGFAPLRAGQAISIDGAGFASADCDCYLVMPSAHSHLLPEGEVAYYLAVKDS